MVRLTPDEARLLAERLLWGPDQNAEPAGIEPVAALAAGAFGRYHVVRLIGLGGMGAVYEAEQDHPRRRVAIKVIRPELMSAEVARRFEHEARILGRLQHPGIAQIYEAGQVDPGGTGAGATPYFAMEFVEGVPLTEFARRGGLGVTARLKLFLRACEAVEHAHRMGVIHRDLKPGNILVDAEGRPRVLDFGVARATDADVRAATMHTEMGRLVGTLPYMSPEQVAGDADGLDTRSDVYSLGVVLYELLAEKLPYDVKRGAVHEAARVITETKPAALSSVSRVFRGDLETIVGKALAKEREKRYQSVGELAADIQRYLSDEPIVARRAGTWYQWRKFAARNRGLVLAVAAAVVLLLITASVAAGWAISFARAARDAARLTQAAQDRSDEAEARRKDAETSAALARSVVNYYNDILKAANPTLSEGAELTVREVLDQGAAHISEALADQLAARVEVEATIATSYAALGSMDSARLHARQAYQAAVDGLGEEDPARLVAAACLGLVLQEDGHPAEAVELLSGALPAAQRIFGHAHEQTLAMMQTLASAMGEVGDYAGAHALASEVVDRSAASGLDHDRAALAARVTVGWTLSKMGRLDEAEATLAAAVDDIRMWLPERSPLRFVAMTLLATHYNSYRRSAEAVGLWTELIAGQTEVFGPDHPDTLTSRSMLADTLAQLKRYDEAEPMFRELIPIRERVQGAEAPGTLTTLHNFAMLLRSRGQPEEAAGILRGVLDARRRTLGPDHPDTLTCTFNLALVLKDLKKLDEAVPLSIAAAEGRRRLLGDDHPMAVRSQYICGRMLMFADRPEQAETYMRRAADSAARIAGLSEGDPAEYRHQLGCCLMATGRFAEAAVEIERSYDAEQHRVGVEAKTTQAILRDLVKAYTQAGQSERGDAAAALLVPEPSKP